MIGASFGSLPFSARRGRIVDGYAAFVGAATLTGNGTKKPRFQASFEGAGELSALPRRIRFAQAALLGTGSLSGFGGRLRSALAAYQGASELTASGRRIRATSAAFAGIGVLKSRSAAVQRSSVAFTGSAALTGSTLFRIYAATKEFATEPSDIPANQPFLGTLQKVIRFDRSIINGGRIGQVTAGWGDMELINADGGYDDLIARYAIDGRRIVVKFGVEGDPYNAFQILFDGTASDWQIEEDVLRIQVRDNSYRLEVPAQPLIYAGTGDLQGTADLKGKRLPLALGDNKNITPVDLIPTELVRQVSSGRVQAIPAVYDRQVPLVFAADYPTTAALRAASTGAQGSGAAIEAGEYGTCLAEGLFKLGGSPVGTITCDVRGDATGTVYVATTATIIRRLIPLATDIKDPDGLITSSFDAVNAAQPAVVGYYFDGSDDRTVADVIANLMGAVGGWGGMRRNGRFELGIFTAPSGTPVAIYDRIDIIDIAREKLPDELSPPPYRFRVAWGRNNTVQTDVDGVSGMTPERLAYLREERRLATSNAASGAHLRADHPLAQDPAPIEAYFRDEAAAQMEADRLIALFGPTSSLYRILLKVRPFSHEIGEVIRVTYPRWDLRQGRLLRIVAVTDDTDANSIEVIGFG